MDKVKEGKATKEELAAEREVLAKHALLEASEVAGIKLFVARLSFDVNEGELRNHFSTHGEITECSIAKDRDTGKCSL